MSLIDALTEEQKTIIAKSLDDKYPLQQAVEDIDLIADLTELKIRLRRCGKS